MNLAMTEFTGRFCFATLLVSLVTAGCGGGATASPAAQPGQGSPSISGGAPAPSPATPSTTSAATRSTPLYTAAQAAQGQQHFRSICSACHGTGEFTGPIFRMTWMADPVGNLFQHISVAMPQDRPGSLKPEEYAAIVAYFLQLNGRPAGDTPLPTDVDLLGRMSW